MSDRKSSRVTLALTGASGAQYGLRLLEALIQAQVQVYLLISDAARIVINTETTYNLPESFDDQLDWLNTHFPHSPGQVKLQSKRDWFSPVASGSSSPRKMVVCPASGGCLSSVATGASNNLIERAADVALKERQQLIFVPREAPYSQVHLENMLKLTKMGATIIPASPGFYQQPQSVSDLVDFIVARILDHLDIDQTLLTKWGEE